jgi:adenylate cyclase
MRKESHLVRFHEEGTVAVVGEQSLLGAALAEGIPLFHNCGGNARCSTCRVLVMRGSEALAPPGHEEQRLREEMRFPPQVRLACQTRVRGNGVQVARIMRDQSDIDLYVGEEAGEATQQIGQEQELVLFFLDIRNFTYFVETHLAFDVIHIVRKLFTAFHGIIDGYGGRIIETAGDGLYAVFGINTGKTQGATAAIAAGHAILAELDRLNETYFKQYFYQSLAIGIGVHAGAVVKGSIRLGQNNHIVVMGHAVNLAARLQNATKELNNSFIVSHAVFGLLPDPPAGHLHTRLALRGVSQPLQVYLLGKPYAPAGTKPVP